MKELSIDAHPPISCKSEVMQKKSTRTKNQIDNGVLFIFSIKSVRL